MYRTAIVTGGTRGIGFEIATKFVNEEYSVVVASRDVDQGRHMESLLRGSVGDCQYCCCDVTNERDVEMLFECAEDYFAGGIDVLINNAGIVRDRTIAKMSYGEWNEVINTNLNGAFLCTREFRKHMNQTTNTRIINISSVVGQMGNFGQANYAASKAGLIGLTKSAALEFAKTGATVNAIAPGFIETDMTSAMPKEMREGWVSKIPLRRFGTPLDVANLVSFLASEKSSYITGQVFNINGGLY